MIRRHQRHILFFICISALLALHTNCGGPSASGPSGNTDSGSSTTPPAPSTGNTTPVSLGQSNVMSVSVGCGYVNEPCVSVTVCVPGTSQCQTIPNVLLDTGSYGLRLYHQVSMDGFNTVTNLITLPMVADPANSSHVLSECVSYADGSSDWGPLAMADVGLGGEKATTVPIQIINSTFGTVPTDCGTPDSSPIGSSGTGFNGILGVGLFTDDCGPGCAPGAQDAASNGIYYSCPSSGSGSCSGVAVAENMQVTNPVALLPVDNNGVILELPNVAVSFGLNDGATAANGYLVLGINTEGNNIPGTVTTFPADANGNFVTVFNGVTSTSSFIDSGSNGLYFPAPNSLPACTDDSSFYCPTSEMNFTAVQEGANGSGSNSVGFSIGNADDEFSQSNPNIVFADLGGTMSSDFDWGLPFFFGRNIYVGIDGRTSSLGSGPLWSY